MGIKAQGRKAVKVRTTGEYPCQWDDLIGADGETLATVYTVQEANQDGLRVGITRGRDGVYDIVVPVKEITHKVLSKVLMDLEKMTDTRYVLSS